MKTHPRLILLFAFLAAAIAVAAWAPPAMARPDGKTINLTAIGRFTSPSAGEGAAEIVAYSSRTERLYVVNALDATVDMVDITDPTAPALFGTIDVTAYGAVANSVSVCRDEVAVAVEADPKTDPGRVVFFDLDGRYLNDIQAGPLPDMVTHTSNCRYILVANEGEPNDDYSIDPEGSVTIIRNRRGAERIRPFDIRTVTFNVFNPGYIDRDVRIFGPNATVAQDLEPEYITTSGNLAYVAMQENNAIAVINIRWGRIVGLYGLGAKDYSLPGNAIDASNRDAGINIQNWPVKSFYQPDAIASYRVNGQTLIVSANEGDARDYDTFSEEARVADLLLDPTAYPNAAELQDNANLGRLTITTANGDTDGDGDIDQIYGYGARSFSIWTATGDLVWDSGDQFERITADLVPELFNSQGTPDSFDSRSDDKGPEPEAVALGKIAGRTYAFVGLERIGGIMVYDVTNPHAPEFVQYALPYDPATETAQDIAPEGLIFVPAGQSPTGKPLVVVSHEVTGSTVIYEVERQN